MRTYQVTSSAMRFCFVSFVVMVRYSCTGQNLWQRLEENEELSEFRSFVSQSQYMKIILLERSGTLFAPTNEAMKSHRGTMKKKLILYHMTNLPVTSDKLPAFLNTDYPGNKPVWISSVDSNSGFSQKIFYVNNARIIKTDIKGFSMEQEPQVLHIIDRVLDPVLTLDTQQEELMNPLASKLLQSSYVYNLQQPITNFDRSVNESKKYTSFERGESSTFFIPIDNPRIPQFNFDAKTIDSHIIPGKVIFNRLANESKFPTLSFSNSLQVVAGIYRVFDTERGIYTDYAISKTILGDAYHPEGIVVSPIILANIPLKNGVAHLIERPLVIVQSSVMELIRQESEGQMKRFHDSISDFAPAFFNELEKIIEATVFIPSNEAFDTVDRTKFSNLLANKQEFLDLLRLHVVPNNRIMFSDTSMSRERPPIMQLRTLQEGRSLVLMTTNDSSSEHLPTVEAGGVKASIVVPDILASNGVIHVINRILGIPFQNVFEKLQNDTTLSESFRLGQQGGFNDRFASEDLTFTYFVPSNGAWQDIRRRISWQRSTIFTQHSEDRVEKILGRHLVIGSSLSSEDLKRQAIRNETIMTASGHEMTATAVRNEMTIGVIGIRATIVRPDVKCTNGVIHVISRVLASDDEIVTDEATAEACSFIVITLGFCVATMIVS